MPDQFQFTIPTGEGGPKIFTLNVGDVLYLLGANGTGKSSLVTNLFNQHQARSKRISAHRQTWFESNTLDMTPRNRHDIESNIRAHDAQVDARYREWNAPARSNVAIYDLIDADTMQERRIAALLRSGNDEEAKREARNPSPIQIINEVMRLSNLPIEISLEEGQKIVARKNGGASYSVAELSDGERNAFLIAANVLTTKTNTLILIDEPERHLHRSIISPLLKLLFDMRKDCTFIVSTHEIMLPIDTPHASTLLVRNCEYEGRTARIWTVDSIPPNSVVDENLKRDLLGARRRMLFVEGTARSLDIPLYSLLFPEVSIVPKEGCRDVEYAVRGLRSAPDLHWIAAWGIVDNDQRSAEDIARLREAGIWALPHYSVESLYYHPVIVARVAERQSRVTGDDPRDLLSSAIENAIIAVRAQKDHLVTGTVLRSTRNSILSKLPNRASLECTPNLAIEIDTRALRMEEEARFDALVQAADLDGLLARYPLRESSAFDRIVSGVKVADKGTYRSAVLKLLQDDPTAVADLRSFLGDLYAQIAA